MASNTSTQHTKAPLPSEPIIHDVFEKNTGTWQYIVADPTTCTAVIIDPVLDYDRSTQEITTQTADSLLSFVKSKKYKIERILETHAHADHLTSASYLQHELSISQGFKPPICIGKRITTVQDFFAVRYGIPKNEYDHVFDLFLDDGETFQLGNHTVTAMHLPGHTPDHLGYKIEDNVFSGDSIFNADIGTARCDFPGGAAQDLYASGQKLLALPEHTKIWPGHDYPPESRGTPLPFMTVAEHRKMNVHLRDGIDKEEFVTIRSERDKKLAPPKLIHQSLQVNIRAGRLPAPTEAGLRFLKLPLMLNEKQWN